MKTGNLINLQHFYPCESLQIIDIDEEKDTICIHMKSETTSCKCPQCGGISHKYHGTYKRKVQDLPILGKRVFLLISSHEYNCENSNCPTCTIAETFDDFINTYSRMTERLSDFLCELALETSCEGAARICKAMNIQTSGDTIIKLLIRKYQNTSFPKCSDTIGVDDFSFKKRKNYGTIIVDAKTHKTVSILDGRDGKALSEWIQQNKHIKAVTRDRASAYAKVLEKELPGIMQIADRFHLHQNLLDTIKTVLYRELPSTIQISFDSDSASEDNTIINTDSKKKFI